MKQKPHHARTLYEILNRSPHFASIAPQIEKLRTLHQQLAESIDSKLLRQCQVADFKEGVLTLIVSSPALGHTFRFLGTELVEKLKKKAPWQSLRTIKTLVRSALPSPSFQDLHSNTSPRLGLSPKSAELLQSTATTIHALPLQQALLKLSAFSSQSLDKDK